MWLYSVLNPSFWHIFCGLIKFVLSEVAILGGRPKNITEEDMSARFFGHFRVGGADFVNKFFLMRGRSGGGSAPLLF